jgi:hypothetical protein
MKSVREELEQAWRDRGCVFALYLTGWKFYKDKYLQPVRGRRVPKPKNAIPVQKYLQNKA